MSNSNIDYVMMSNAIRALSMDAVQKANSGHPGMPMGMAEMATVLWHKHLNFNAKDDKWLNRDRFILSNGHGSMLIYSLLHLCGFDLDMQEIKNFRQLHSKTPGHPEYGITKGIETSTGPLGQGLANAVGMALAERLLGLEFNKPDLDIINHYTYVFAGDGCLMEGISHEVASLAGTLNLSKLIVLYDDNGISIDGKVAPWFSDDTPKRFESYGWAVIPNVDGHDINAIDEAIIKAKSTGKPTLICCKTAIGKGSPNLAGSDKVHGAPLGDVEIKATREFLKWEHEPFSICDTTYALWRDTPNKAQNYNDWQAKFSEYKQKYPNEAKELERRINQKLPHDFEAKAIEFAKDCQNTKANIATRKASQNAIEAFASILPEMLGGSADLTSSNLTNWSKSIPLRDGFGNHINYGVREFGMSAIINGISLYGGYIPFGGTFLTFSDYSRNALRMSALMKIRSIFVFTHDSIGLGEDGPTHQPIEHVSSLRLIPNMYVWRPADTTETMIAWADAIKRTNAPSSLIFSRQNLPCLDKSDEAINDIAKGGYIISKEEGNLELVILATGSEVSLAFDVKAKLAEKGKKGVRIVSIPCLDLFETQSQEYKQQVLGNAKTIAIEAGVSAIWYKYANEVFGIDTFGESAPANVLFEYFGLTAENIASKI